MLDLLTRGAAAILTVMTAEEKSCRRQLMDSFDILMLRG